MARKGTEMLPSANMQGSVRFKAERDLKSRVWQNVRELTADCSENAKGTRTKYIDQPNNRAEVTIHESVSWPYACARFVVVGAG